jgi:hypothetical protein
VKKLVQETGGKCHIVGLAWLSACLEGKSRCEHKDYVLFDPLAVAAAAAKKSNGNVAAAVGGSSTEGGSGGTRYRLVDVNKFACSQASHHAAARNHNKVPVP